MGAHARRRPMEHRADFEIDGLDRAEGALHLGQGPVDADRLFGREALFRHISGDHVDAVEAGLGGDRVVGAAIDEARVHAATTIDRLEFGMNSGFPLVSRDVELTISSEAAEI